LFWLNLFWLILREGGATQKQRDEGG